LVSVTLSPSEADKCKCLLTQMVTEATLTKSDADRLADLCESIWKCVRTIQNGNAEKTDRRMYVEALAQVKNALGIACGSISLLENKATLLTTMNRWRETASFLERLACSRVPLEAVFHEVDLASHNPFPGIPKAKFLSASSFANVDEADEEFEVKLNSKACGEAVLRLPYSLTQTYLRALRLEERYPSAEAALKSLEELVERGLHVYNTSSMQSKFSWLSREYIKLNRTKKGREYGDKLFRLQDYDLAAKEYGKCLAIDGEDSGNTSSGTAGGRLHAVLYCNRAACYMALHRYSDALDECAAALRIHSRYMKALLRRARCYSRLNRCEEAIREYEKWRELAAEGKIYPKTSSGGSPCWFDLPREVTAVDVDTVLKELDEVHVIKRRMDAASREAENRRNEWQRRHENTHSQSFGRGSRPNPTAQQRRNDWRNQQNDPRHWDTFSGRNPRSGPSASSGSSGQPGFDRSRSWNNGPNVGGSHSAHQRSNIGSPGSDLSISHYVVLGIDINATARDVKKAYRAKALTEHPDKNIHDPNAADKFRRIQMAYEILSDAQTRYKYDLEQGYGRR
jgi:tetratricopeptide (TPR) repeat protein